MLAKPDAGLQRSGGSWTAGVDTNKLPLLPLSKFPRRGSPITEDRRTLAVSTSCPNAMKTKLEPWTVDDFTLIREIGKGRASVVHHAVCKHGHLPVALKVYRKAGLTDVTRRQVEREVAIHSKASHPHIVDCYVVFEDAAAIYLALEYAPGGDLMKVLEKGRRLNEGQTREALAQVLSALEYLHGLSIIHRDIKPENILVMRSGALKLADLGTAIDLRQERAVSRLGTLDYMAPEVLRCPDKRAAADHKERADLGYCTAVDAWAVGILAFELLTGAPPFERDTVRDTVAEIMGMAHQCPAWMPPAASGFIELALAKDAAARPAVGELATHHFVQPSPSPAGLAGQDSLAEVLMPGSMLTRHHSLEVNLSPSEPAHSTTQSSRGMHRAPSASLPASPLGRSVGPSPLSSPAPRSPQPQSPLAQRCHSVPLSASRLGASPSRFACEAARQPSPKLETSRPLAMRTLFAELEDEEVPQTPAKPPTGQARQPPLTEKVINAQEYDTYHGVKEPRSSSGAEDSPARAAGATLAQSPLSTPGFSSKEAGPVALAPPTPEAIEARSSELIADALLVSHALPSPTSHAIYLPAGKKPWHCDVGGSPGWSASLPPSPSDSYSLSLSPASSCSSLSLPDSPRLLVEWQSPVKSGSAGMACAAPKRCHSASTIKALPAGRAARGLSWSEPRPGKAPAAR
mmetsp:Transcript_24590/g.61791  ORF Transcript_24590/g.61791 Transcript_24590/m.61791 type:complete len:688 (+) Transcript_24590:629-2692(+)